MAHSPHTAAPVSALTQAERTALSDSAMLDAAKQLLLELGLEKTTLAAIGERAGYSRGLASYRFGSKAGLFDELCKSISRQWLDYLGARVGAQNGIAAMCTALDTFFAFISEYPVRHRFCRFSMAVRPVRRRSIARRRSIFTSGNSMTLRRGSGRVLPMAVFAMTSIRRALPRSTLPIFRA